METACYLIRVVDAKPKQDFLLDEKYRPLTSKIELTAGPAAD